MSCVSRPTCVMMSAMANREPDQPSASVEEDAAPWSLASAYLRNRADPAAAMARAEKWAEQNAEAIRAYNAFVEEHGVVGDELRNW